MLKLLQCDKIFVKAGDHLIYVHYLHEAVRIDYHVSQKIRYYKSILRGALFKINYITIPV